MPPTSGSPPHQPVQAGLFSRRLGRLSVRHKLQLIDLPDLLTVIYVSGILVNEEFITIDVARQEVQGKAEVQAVRDPLIDAALAAALRDAAAGPGQSAPVDTVLMRGRALLTRVANQSNLILDPDLDLDLDSVDTMSLLALRYPELLEQAHGLGQRLQRGAMARDAGEQRPRHLIFEGRPDATAQGIQSDPAEASAAGGAALQQALQPQHEALAATSDMFRRAARDVTDQGATPTTVAPRLAVQRDAVLACSAAGWPAPRRRTGCCRRASTACTSACGCTWARRWRCW